MMIYLFIYLIYVMGVGLPIDCECSIELAKSKIDRIAKKHYKKIDFKKRITETPSSYEIYYYRDQPVIGGDITAAIRKSNCKIICLELGQ